MAKCGSCIHKDACSAWMDHIDTLYDYSEYSVEDCPYYAEPVDAVAVTRCQNCGWWHRHKSGDLSRGVCDKYAMSKSENGYCDEPLLEERK